MTFKVGDVVKLKSGGPAMTVTGIITDDENRVSVTWFQAESRSSGEGYLDVRYDTFPAGALDRAST